LLKFINDQVDLIVVYPTEATIEAQKVTEGTNIPVVFTFVLIEDMNIVASIKEPGGNLTGVRYPGPDIALKRYEVMMELLPDAKTILVPYQRGYPIVPSQLAEINPSAEANGVTLIEAPADNAQELEAVLRSLREPGKPHIDGILLLAETLGVTPDAEQVMCKYATENKTPIGGALFTADSCESIFGVGVEPYIAGQEAAPLADQVLRGTKPADIPIVSSESFLQFNFNAASEFGIIVPEGLLKQADEVIHK
jgi:putative ABC transport system substrate-binding protein